MNNPAQLSEVLNRTVKLALDTGEAASISEAEQIFASYRLQVLLGPDVQHSPVLQSIALTAINCAARTLLGGVMVIGAGESLAVILPGFANFPQAITGLGATLSVHELPDVPTIVIGDVKNSLDPLAIRATFEGWSGGVVPLSSNLRLSETGNYTPAGVLAGSIAVSEIFQRLRGNNPYACRRATGINLWKPERDWYRYPDHQQLDELPASAWLVGLGNLGQAYLWTLGLLPYKKECATLVLQDFDYVAPSNVSTSLLTTSAEIGLRKTRAMATWAGRRGFDTTIVERRFESNFRVGSNEPRVALIGVDNALARQSIESVGFERVIEAGLGRGVDDFLGINMHTFPASITAKEMWRETGFSDVDLSKPAYQNFLSSGEDKCGTVRLAGRTIAAPFVGAMASAIVVSELVRISMGAARYESFSGSLRDLSLRTLVRGNPWGIFNPGTLAA